MFNEVKWYKLGKKSVESFRNAVKNLLGNTKVSEELAPAAPHLCGKNVDLSGYELYAIAEWLENPEGPPPSAKFQALREMLRECQIPLDDEELEKIAESNSGDLL